MTKTQQETNVWKRAQLDLSPLGYRVFRNQRYKGKIVKKGFITNGWADCGLTDGAGDLIGYRIVTITQDMVGQKIAQFCSLEAKTDSGTPSEIQLEFNEQIRKDGGIAGIIRPKTGINITEK